MTRNKRNESVNPVTKKQEKDRRKPTKQKRQKLGWWKFYIPFCIVVFLLHFRFWHAEPEWVYKTLFPSDHKAVIIYILIVLFVVTFVPYITYVYKHRGRWKFKWYHWDTIGIGFILCGIPSVFLANVVFVMLMWLNSLSCSAPYEQEYRAKVVEIYKDKPYTPMRHSGARWVNSFPYTQLFVSSIDNNNKPYHGVYTSYDSGRMLEQIDDLRLIVRQKDGWLGFGVIERISIAAKPGGDSVSTERSPDGD